MNVERTPMIDELKGILLEIGIEEDIVRELDHSCPLAGNVIESADYPAFLAVLEERYGVRIDDRYALRLKNLDDFAKYISQG